MEQGDLHLGSSRWVIVTCLKGSMVGRGGGLTFDSIYLQGYINLGTSENKLCTDLLAERLSQSDMTYVDEDLLQYTDWRGQPL